MPAIGFVTKNDDGSYRGSLKTLSIKAPIEILPNSQKAKENHPDYRVISEGVEVGAAWIRTGRDSGEDYVSMSLAAPEFGSRSLYCNLGPAAGQDDPSVYALIWNPTD